MNASHSLFRRLYSRLWLHNAPTTDMHTIPGIKARPFLYQRYPPWWAQWAYAIIAVDIFQTVTVMELTWTRWTTLDPSQDAKTTPKEERIYHPEAAWKRAAVCFAHAGIGIGIGTALIVARNRYLRTFTIINPTKGRERQLFIQSAAHTGSRGLLYPMSRCHLQTGRNKGEIILRVDGERGHWFMSTMNAFVFGKKPQDELDVKTMKKDERENWKRECAFAVRHAIIKEWGPAKKVGDWEEKELERHVLANKRMRAMERLAATKRPASS